MTIKQAQMLQKTFPKGTLVYTHLSRLADCDSIGFYVVQERTMARGREKASVEGEGFDVRQEINGVTHFVALALGLPTVQRPYGVQVASNPDERAGHLIVCTLSWLLHGGPFGLEHHVLDNLDGPLPLTPEEAGKRFEA